MLLSDFHKKKKQQPTKQTITKQKQTNEPTPNKKKNLFSNDFTKKSCGLENLLEQFKCHRLLLDYVCDCGQFTNLIFYALSNS